MSNQIDTEYVSATAKAAAEKVSAEIQEIYGPLWEAREDLAKLVVSLSSAILVGTITFSGGLIGVDAPTATCPFLVIYSWCLLFLALSAGVVSLWFSANLKSFRLRLTNAEPQLIESAGKLDPSLPLDELQKELIKLVVKYANSGSKPIGRSDSGSGTFLKISLVSFGLGLGVFLWFGALQVT
jgi:hypothetical protein